MSNPNQPPDANPGEHGMVSCRACNKEIHSSAATCPHCGAPRRTSRYKSKVAAAVLAFFLGGFGVHRFYLGQWWGVFYLLFFWLWIPGLIALVEFIYFLVCDTREWDNKYNEGIPAGPNDKSSGALIAISIIIGGVFLIAIIGILAAVAIPAYHDYTLRTKVHEALLGTRPIKTDFVNYYRESGEFPDTNSEINIQDPYMLTESSQLTLTSDGIHIIFGGDSHALRSETLTLTPSDTDAGILWDCTGGTLENRYRPHSCKK